VVDRIDQMTLLTWDIEDSFSAKKEAEAVFVDTTAAYDTTASRPHLQLTAIAT